MRSKSLWSRTWILDLNKTKVQKIKNVWILNSNTISKLFWPHYENTLLIVPIQAILKKWVPHLLKTGLWWSQCALDFWVDRWIMWLSSLDITTFFQNLYTLLLFENWVTWFSSVVISPMVSHFYETEIWAGWQFWKFWTGP